MILVKIVHILWFNTILPVYLGIWPPSGRDLAPLAARGWPRNDEKKYHNNFWLFRGDFYAIEKILKIFNFFGPP